MFSNLLHSVSSFLKKRTVVVFILILGMVYGILNFHKTIFYRPQSIHQWAQCDRGSIARNYAEESMNFFLPRVHHTRDLTGITGLEFPIVNYTAAVFYKIFGFNEFWYRFVMLMCITVSLVAAFKFANRYLSNIWLAIVSVLLWFLSPILNYYSPNFIPDTASLALAMISWFYFFNSEWNPSKSRVFWWFALVTLATLIKVTSGVSIVAVLMLIAMDKYKMFGLKGLIPHKLLYVLLSITSVAIVYAWYYWARYITVKFGAQFFAQAAAYPQSWAEVQEVWQNMKMFYIEYYYSYTLYAILAVSLIAALCFYKRNNPLIIMATVLMLIGNMAVMALFFNQFRQHDYYIIVLLAPFFFLMLMGAKLILSIQMSRVKSILIVIISITLVYSLHHSARFQHNRYNSWMNDPAATFPEYWELEAKLRAVGIKREDRIASMFDYSTNISLYLLNQKGWLLDKSYSPEYIESVLIASKYAVVNNLQVALEKGGSKHFSKLLYHEGIVYVFALTPEVIPEEKRLHLEE